MPTTSQDDVLSGWSVEGDPSGSSFAQSSKPLPHRIANELKRARDSQMNQRKEADLAEKFYVGHQWEPSELERMGQLQKPAITYNRIAPIVNAVIGYAIQNRQRMIFVSRDPLDNPDSNGVSDLATGAYEWAIERCDGDHERESAFRDLCVRGLAWVGFSMDYGDDLDGKFVLSRIDPDEIWYDPSARKQNLSDANWVARQRRVHIDEIGERWGKQKQTEVRAAGLNETETGLFPNDTTVPTVVRNLSPDLYAEGSQQVDPGIRDLLEEEKGYVVLTEFEWREFEEVYRILGPEGDVQTISGDEYKALKKRARLEELPTPRAVKMSRYAYKRVNVCGPVQLDDEPEDIPFPYFTYQAMTLFWDKTRRYWYGLVRAMIDPQRGANKYLSLGVHLLSISPKGTYLVEQGALKSPQTFAEDIARPGAVIWLTEGAIAGQNIKIEPPPQIPAVTNDLMQFSITSLHDVSGIQPDFLGMQGDAATSRASTVQKRQTQGLTILAWTFNILTLFRRTEARVTLEFLRNFMTDERWIRIGGPNDGKYLQLLKEDLPVKYDLVLDDVPVDPNEKRYVWEMIQPQVGMMMKMGMFDPEFFELMPAPKSVISRIRKKWDEAEEQQRQAAMQQQQPTKKDEDPAYIESETAVNHAQAEWLKARAEALKQESAMDMAVQTQDILLKDRDARHGPMGGSEAGKGPGAKIRLARDQSLDNVSENAKNKHPQYPGTRATNSAT